MAGVKKVDIAKLEEVKSGAAALGQQVQTSLQQIKGLADPFINGRFNGNVQRNAAAAFGQLDSSFQSLYNNTDDTARRLAAFGQRMIDADGGTMAFGGSGLPAGFPAGFDGNLDPNMSPDVMYALGLGSGAPNSPLTSGGLFDSLTGLRTDLIRSGSAAFLPGDGSVAAPDLINGFPGLSGVSYGIDGSAWSDSIGGSTTIGGIPVSGSAYASALGGDMQAVFNPLHGDAYLAGELYGAKAGAEGNIGTSMLGASGNVNATVLGANGTIGLHDGEFGAKIGATLASVGGDVNAHVAGMDMGVGAEVGLKADLGFSVGDKVKVDLPFVSVSVKPPSIDQIAAAPGNLLNDLSDAVGGDVGSAIGSVGDAVNTITNIAANPIGSIGDTIGDTVSAVTSTIDTASDLVGGVGDAIGDVGGAIGDAAGAVGDFFGF